MHRQRPSSLPARAPATLRALALAAAVASISACKGQIQSATAGDAPPEAAQPGATTPGSGTPVNGGGLITMAGGTNPFDPKSVPGNDGTFDLGASGMRRLTRTEYDNTLASLVGDTTRPGGSTLPEDSTDPFDNDFHTQQVSPALIESAERLATDVSARALASTTQRAKIVPCTPTGTADTACLKTFVEKFGRRAFRRPLTTDEVDGFMTLGASVTDGDFYTKVDAVLRAMLQDPQFLYRVEVGTPDPALPGLYKLTPFEVATRLAYFLTGTMPSDGLLDAAAAGQLDTPDQIRAQAQLLIATPEGQAQIDRFHALWLGYAQLPHPMALSAAMRAESSALVHKVVFEDRSDYLSLFKSTKTFLNDTLAANYGMPAPGSTTGVWVDYGQGSTRKGILSHGAFLSAGAKVADTSPTLRGLFVRNRLLCETVPPPPPNVPASVPTTVNSSRCKKDRYAAHTSGGSCLSCHKNMDPIGFGLENYDKTGKFRATDDGAPECSIAGDGAVDGVGGFNGPGQLSQLLADSGRLESCIVRQVFRFAMGRREDAPDIFTVRSLTRSFTTNGRHFDDLMLDLVASAAFNHRREE